MPPAGHLARAVGRFGPPLALMGVIFALSAQPNLNSGLGTIDLVGRKLVHMTEYGLLWLLWLRALDWRRPWTAAAIAVAFAMTDELHQTFIHGRHGTPIDVAIDSLGIAVAAFLWSHRTAVSRANRRP
jgi:VanZ family protein